MAGAIIGAINRTGFAAFGATAKLRGGKTIFLDGALLDPANPDPAQAVQAITPARSRRNSWPAFATRPATSSKPTSRTARRGSRSFWARPASIIGDLPDDPNVTDDFRTLLVSNGARHVQLQDVSLRLGSRLDTEIDGQPTAAADGDDAGGLVDLSGAPPLSLALLPMSTIQAPDAWHIADNGTFQISDGVRTVTFTMDLDGGLPPASHPVVYIGQRRSGGDRAERRAGHPGRGRRPAIWSASRRSQLGRRPAERGGRGADQPRTAGLTLDSTAPVVFQVPGDPLFGDEAEIIDGGTFQVRAGNDRRSRLPSIWPAAVRRRRQPSCTIRWRPPKSSRGGSSKRSRPGDRRSAARRLRRALRQRRGSRSTAPTRSRWEAACSLTRSCQSGSTPRRLSCWPTATSFVVSDGSRAGRGL